MNLSTTSSYAIRILSFIAIQKKQLISAKELITNLNISDKYLRNLMTMLAQKGLIQSTQGRGGGYRLKRNMNEIYLIEIIGAVEDENKYLGCVLGFKECSNTHPCAVHHLWNDSKTHTTKFLQETNLMDIVDQNKFEKY